MAKRFKLEFDSSGFHEVLNSAETRAMVTDAANRIAQSVRSASGGSEVVLDNYTTDRAASAVTLLDSRAMQMQAESGIMTRAAGSIGAEVRTRR